MSQLKQVLFDDYGGLQHGRIRKRGDIVDIIIDDRGEDDFDEEGQLVFWFCTINAEISAKQIVTVNLRGVLPVSAALRDWARLNGALLTEEEKCSLRFSFGPGQQERLDHLARVIHAMSARNRCFPFPFLRYICARTARSLHRLRANLDMAWN